MSTNLADPASTMKLQFVCQSDILLVLSLPATLVLPEESYQLNCICLCLQYIPNASGVIDLFHLSLWKVLY
jgi:hypothetical protein